MGLYEILVDECQFGEPEWEAIRVAFRELRQIGEALGLEPRIAPDGGLEWRREDELFGTFPFPK